MNLSLKIHSCALGIAHGRMIDLQRFDVKATWRVGYTEERLRIVPQDLWDAVRERQATVRRASAAVRTALQRTDGRPPRHLLSGLLKCGCCGGSYIVVNAHEYGCATHKQGGPAACGNGVRLKRRGIEAEILRRVRDDVLSPEAVKLAAETYTAELRKADRSRPKAPANGTLSAKKREIAQLKDMQKAGKLSPTVAQAAIQAAEAEWSALARAQAAKADRAEAKVVELWPFRAQEWRELIDTLPTAKMLPAELVEARALVVELLGEPPQVVPRADGVGLKVREDILPLLNVARGNVANVVAGARYGLTRSQQT